MGAAKIGNGTPSVKSFSLRFRLLTGFISFYAGWFFANALLPGGFGQLVAASVIFAIGLGIALFFLASGFAQIAGHFRGHAGIRHGSGGGAEFDSSTAVARLMTVSVTLVLFALHVKVCAIERVEVAGSSMHPTLKSGEVIWIEKISTGLQLPDLSFPFGGVSETGKLPRFGFESFQRGDVVVFRYPGVSNNDNDYYIKRVIAVPGDSFELAGGQVYVNGEELVETYLPEGTRTFPRANSDRPSVYPLPIELNLLSPDVRQSALFGAGHSGQVPEHTLLVMGDNRAQSRDSRSIGFVPAFFVLGVAL